MTSPSPEVAAILVTGSSGAGKSTICTSLKSQGRSAFDADWDGLNRWVNRATDDVVIDPPYPVPAGWLDHFGWEMSRSAVEELVANAREETVFICGSAENEAELLDLFDLVICLAIDNETLRNRLLTRDTNAFGTHPEEMAAAIQENDRSRSKYRDMGATVIDGTLPPAEVLEAVLAAVASAACQTQSAEAPRGVDP